MYKGFEDAPRCPDTVAPECRHNLYLECSCHQSRLGTVIGQGNGAFQASIAGKYSCFSGTFPHSHDVPAFSELQSTFLPGHHRCNSSTTLSTNAAQPSPGRLTYSLMEAPNHSDAVELPASDQLSRPGPAFGSREGVFHTSFSGEYNRTQALPCPEVLSVSRPHHRQITPVTARDDLLHPDDRSAHRTTARMPLTTYAALPSPGRPLYCPMEAPKRSDVVEFPASDQRSRPGPAFRDREGVFHTGSPGEYLCSRASSHADHLSVSRPRPGHSRQGFRSTGPGPITSSPAEPSHLSVDLDTRGDSSNSSDGSKLNIYYQNVNGMNTRAQEYYLASSDEVYDILLFTESWLDDRTLDAQVFGQSYEVFRCDRSSKTSTKVSGGGVAVAVRKDLRPKLLESEEWSCVEQVWITIKLGNRKLYLCCVYFPPKWLKDSAVLKAHSSSVMSVLSRAQPKDEIVIMGDFNLEGVNWKPSRDGFFHPIIGPSARFVAQVNKLLDVYSTATLSQVNGHPNEFNHWLDLCFVSRRDVAPSVTIAPAPIVRHVRHHPPLLCNLDSHVVTEFNVSIAPVRYDFRKADVPAILELLASIDWHSCLDRINVDEAVKTFSDILGYAIDRHVPKKRIRQGRVPWQTDALRKLKTLKRAALRSFSKRRTLALRDHYFQLNSRYRALSRQCYANYERRTQQKLKRNPKAFWKHVNEQRREHGLPSSMMLDGEVGSTPNDICKLFAQKFSRVFTKENLSPQQVSVAADMVPLHNQTLADIDIDDHKILVAAAKLKSSCTAGPDGIPSVMLKKCITELLTPLRMLFSSSLSYGTFPALWKQAYMFPVHKSGDRRNVHNYRGISCLCAVSKLFELVVMDPVFSFCKSLISVHQHGYLPGRSTTTNLLTFTEHVTESMVNRFQTDAVYTDLSAAFDKLNHAIAVAKLDRMGLHGNLLRWFQSYLNGRTLNVKIGECISDLFEAFSGIAQGSHLGPLVFLLYYNDSNHALQVPSLSFADDMKIYCEVKTLDDAWHLQQQLDVFTDWCTTNRMILNPQKCSVISFTRKKKPIIFEYRLSGVVVARQNCVKDLGVLLDSELKFSQHISYIVAKASRQLGFIFRTAKNFTDIYCLKTLYSSLVRSTLEYCSAVWNPHFQRGVDRIEAVQRRFIRYALRNLPWRDPVHLPSYESRCQLIHLDTLGLRRDVARAQVVSDTLSSRIDCPEILHRISLQARSRTLRHNTLIRLPFRPTIYSANGAVTGLLRMFNRVASVFDFNLSRDVIRNKFFMLLRR